MLEPDGRQTVQGVAARRVIVPLDVPALMPARAARDAKMVSLSGETMGTTWSVKCVLSRQMSVESLRAGIQVPLDSVIAQMSTWIESSDISCFNHASANSWHKLPQDFGFVLAYALSLAEETGGAYDPASGALVGLWGFGPASRPRSVPALDEISGARSCCGWRHIKRDKTRGVFQPGGVELDLSSIAKGFAVDKVSASLHARGLHDHLVEIGGELSGQGIKPDGGPWWVALESFPSKADGAKGAHDAVVALHGLAVATSGDHVRFFEQGGERFSHTIDPRSGYPVTHALTSVTVIHSSCMKADALATALFVLGPEAGFDFAAHHSVAARFVSRVDDGYAERMTPQLVAMFDE